MSSPLLHLTLKFPTLTRWLSITLISHAISSILLIERRIRNSNRMSQPRVAIVGGALLDLPSTRCIPDNEQLEFLGCR